MKAMDTLRSAFDSSEPSDTDGLAVDRAWDALDEEGAEPSARRDLPPESIGQDERRMQVRAYNHWASLLGERMFPRIDGLDPSSLPDFGPHSVLLDFSHGIENPEVRFLGVNLAHECSAHGVITRLSDVPPRSPLSRITDHYMQILANQAPIGFEAEFVNQRGVAILYRGILLPFSSNADTIDFIYGVINWKEMADQLTADELLLEIDQALELDEPLELTQEPPLRAADPVTDWADSPAHEIDDIPAVLPAATSGVFGALVSGAELDRALSLPDFGRFTLDDDEEYDEDEGDGDADGDDAGYSFASLADYIEAPIKKAIDPADFAFDPDLAEPDEPEYDNSFKTSFDSPFAADRLAGIALADDTFAGTGLEDTGLEDTGLEDAGLEDTGLEDTALETNVLEDTGLADAGLEDAGLETVAPEAFDNAVDADIAFDFSEDLPEDAGLYDCLASARELARTADSTEDRSRCALYAAVSRAYDFSLAAQASPDDYAELIAESGLTVQDRAPMTPVVKLVFGHDYDKTRLTEYAAVLTHAHRLRLERGSLAGFLAEVEGGLKAVVKAERRLRRDEQGKVIEADAAVRAILAERLRALEAITLEALDGAGPEFALVLIRRDEIGCVELLAELPEDAGQIERAARKLVG